MKYLFAYSYSARKYGNPTSGEGSMNMTVTGTDRITEDVIYGKNGCVEIVTKELNKCGLTDVHVVPMGWFKFEDDADMISRERVLNIVDAEAWAYCDYLLKALNGNSDYQRHVSALTSNIRERIMNDGKKEENEDGV